MDTTPHINPVLTKHDTIPDRLYTGEDRPNPPSYEGSSFHGLAQFFNAPVVMGQRESTKGSLLRALRKVTPPSVPPLSLSSAATLKRIAQKLCINESDSNVENLYRNVDSIGKTLLNSCIETLEPREIIAVLNGTYIEHSFKKGDFSKENPNGKPVLADKRFYILDINREGSGSDVYPALYVDCAHPHAFQKVILKTVKRRREEEFPKDPDHPENTENIKILRNLTDTEYFSRYGTLSHEADMAEVIYLHQNSWHPELTGFIRPVDIVSYKATDIRVHISETLPFAEDLKDLSLFIVYQEEKIKTYLDAFYAESISNSKFWRVFAHILLEINQLHIKKLVHRDLKPENIAFCMKEQDKDRGVILDLGSLRTFYEIRKGEFQYYQIGTNIESEGKKISPDTNLDTLEALVQDSNIEIVPNHSGITPFYFNWRCAIEAQRGNILAQAEDLYSLGVMLAQFNKNEPRCFPEEKQAILNKIIAGLTSYSAEDENYQFIHGKGENSLYSLMQGREFMQKDEEEYAWSALEGIAHFILETYPEEKQQSIEPPNVLENSGEPEAPITQRSIELRPEKNKDMKQNPTVASLSSGPEVVIAQPYITRPLTIIPPGPETLRAGSHNGATSKQPLHIIDSSRQQVLSIRPEDLDFSDLPTSKQAHNEDVKST